MGAKNGPPKAQSSGSTDDTLKLKLKGGESTEIGGSSPELLVQLKGEARGAAGREAHMEPAAYAAQDRAPAKRYRKHRH